MPPTHLAEKNWQQAMAQLAALLDERGVHASRAIVLVPYAQLMQQARNAWSQWAAQSAPGAAAAFFVPRFETTMNWASSLDAARGGFVATEDDIRLDAAVDVLTAASLLERAGLGAQQHTLAGRLLESAWSLARVAAAQAPEQRLAWGAQMATELGAGLESPSLRFELAVARIALIWAASSAYPTDLLFEAGAELLVVLEGFQSEPLVEVLRKRFGEAMVSIPLNPLAAEPVQGAIALHAAADAEDEAQLAAACVLAHLAQGHKPVALIAQDRSLTRRVRAMLAERGVALRDETGWTLSTTRAAATVMSLLRALPWDASADAVLDWLKNAPAFAPAAVTRAEIFLRRSAVRFWRSIPAEHPELLAVAAPVQALRDAWQQPRQLSAWLRELRASLQLAGQWPHLVTDVGGSAVLEALYLQDGYELGQAATVEMNLQGFSSWVNQALEAASFSPVHPPEAQVVILPLSQLLGRSMQAVVLPGCDEVRLAVSPEPPGMWTPAQRELLGLPSRAELAAAQRAAWAYALRLPRMDLLWRQSEGGERLMPSGYVQELLLQQGLPSAADPRTARFLPARPTQRPLPTGEALPVTRLSASAYEDLRRCPYRFFALRQLRLQEAGELENEISKRDFGNWLHTLLHFFHLALNKAAAPNRQDRQARLAMINQAADEATTELGLSSSEFLPFAAIWPRVREGYLEWLEQHEASGARFVEGEVWKNMPLGRITLVGKIDRVDQMPDGSHLVMDYKTEVRTTTQARISQAQEDTQLAFYAALLADDTLAAAYVNLGEKEPSRSYEQPDIVQMRDGLIQSILKDMSAIENAAPLPALGEGKACEYCAARGLCRKDFW